MARTGVQLTIQNRPVGVFTELHGSCGFIGKLFQGGDWFLKSPDYQAYLKASGLSVSSSGDTARATVFFPNGDHLIAEGRWVKRADGTGTFDNRTTTIVGGVAGGISIAPVEDEGE